jgi:hypothetical protein
MKQRMATLILAALLMSTVALLPKSAEAATKPFKAIPITGTTATGGSFVGTFDVQNFVNQGGQVFAVGNLTGKLFNGNGQLLGIVKKLIALNVLFGNHSCTILELTLGPLDLNLLGLMVHLDEVHLTITANPAGGLLGDLLCSIANAIDLGAPGVATLVALLNQLLHLLG